MDNEKRHKLLETFTELLDGYAEMIKSCERSKALSKSDTDDYAEIAKLYDKSADLERAVLVALFESALL